MFLCLLRFIFKNQKVFTTLYQCQFFPALEPGKTDMGVHILLAIQGLVMYAVQSYFHCSYISLIRKEKHKKKNSVLTIQQEELGLSKHPVSLPCRQPVHYRAGRGIRIHSAQVRRGKHGPLQVSLAGHDQSQPAQVPLITWRREKRQTQIIYFVWIMFRVVFTVFIS